MCVCVCVCVRTHGLGGISHISHVRYTHVAGADVGETQSVQLDQPGSPGVVEHQLVVGVCVSGVRVLLK